MGLGWGNLCPSGAGTGLPVRTIAPLVLHSLLQKRGTFQTNLVLFQRIKLTLESVILQNVQVLPGLAPEERPSRRSVHIAKCCVPLHCYTELLDMLIKIVNTF